MDNRVQYIYDKLMNEKVKFGADLVSDYCSKFQKTERTFWSDWKKAKDLFDEFSKKKIETANEISLNNQEKAITNGLKSKLELVLEVQKMLDDDNQEETFFDIVTKTEHKYYRKLTPLERKALYERISKFEGMDAPTKSEQKIDLKIGKDLADESYT